jgi:hypothetical protein
MLEHRNGGEITSIPEKRVADYDFWRSLLNARDANAERSIKAALNDYVDGWLEKNRDNDRAAICSSWIPGLNWEDGNNGVYQPIYDALHAHYIDDGMSFDRAGWFFGLLLLDVMIERDEDWVCWHEPHAREEEPLGMFYRPRATIAA